MSYVPKEQTVVDQSILTPGRLQQPKTVTIDPIAYLSQSTTDLTAASGKQRRVSDGGRGGRLRLPPAPTSFACAMLMFLGTTTAVLQVCKWNTLL